MEQVIYRPIGIIHTPFHKLKGMPIQPGGAQGVCGTIEIREDCLDGLQDLDGFSHIILLYHFHKSKGYSLEVIPFLDEKPRGLFATRAPRRPNALGMSVVELLEIEDTTVHIMNVDMLDGTPLLDIKPYLPDLDHQEPCRNGWLEKSSDTSACIRSDDRFDIDNS